MKTLKIIVSDGTASASLIAFNRQFLQNSLPVGSIIAITGTFSEKYGQIQSTSFEAVKMANSGNLEDFQNTPLPDTGILPVYPLTEGLKQKNIRKFIQTAINQYVHGIEKSYSAVQNPTEGTILTVFRESTEYAAASMNENSTIEDFFRLHIEEAKRSLEKTKEI